MTQTNGKQTREFTACILQPSKNHIRSMPVFMVKTNSSTLSIATNGREEQIEDAQSFSTGAQIKHQVVSNQIAPKQVIAKPVLTACSSGSETVAELTDDELVDRHWLELRVERAFYDAGCALRELRDRRLYRDTHPDDFIGYCRDRFDKTKQAVNYLIAAASVYENLTTTIGCRDDDNQVATNGCRILPTSERQVRDLTGLEPDEQRQIWNEAIEQADGKVPSGRIVKGIVERLRQKPLTKAKDFCQIGDVFTLTGLRDTERKYNGCSVIAIGANDFTLEVEVHDAVLTVKPDNLNPIDSPDVRRQLPTIVRRIKRLRECGLLDRGAYVVLESLGKQTYLTEIEEKLLSLLESHYGIV